MSNIEEVTRKARAASQLVQSLSAGDREKALSSLHKKLSANRKLILLANEADRAESGSNIEPSLLKRLDLSGKKYDAMLEGISSVLSLPDPVGRCTLSRKLDEGLELYRVTCPIGVIGVIFEARPEAAVQISSLAIKSANAVILKGGREATKSNNAIVDSIRAALREADYPEDAVQLLSTRGEVRELLAQSKHVDLIIPRGSNALVQYIQENTKIPVMGHADGICAVYLDTYADPEKAARIVVDAKAQYPAVCNAAEQLLAHKDAAERLLPVVGKALADAGVTVIADDEAKKILDPVSNLKVEEASDADFETEFLNLTIAVRIVDSIESAIRHINEHGSGHTDVIVTENSENARMFLNGVDSAGVYHNASSRFADGFRYGFGAEVGVSTHRTHARGPVGMDGLMIYKYKMVGDGHIVAPYVSGEKRFTHEDFNPEKGKYCALIK